MLAFGRSRSRTSRLCCLNMAQEALWACSCAAMRRSHDPQTDPSRATSRMYEVVVLATCLVGDSAGVFVPFLGWEAGDQLDCEASVTDRQPRKSDCVPSRPGCRSAAGGDRPWEWWRGVPRHLAAVNPHRVFPRRRGSLSSSPYLSCRRTALEREGSRKRSGRPSSSCGAARRSASAVGGGVGDALGDADCD